MTRSVITGVGVVAPSGIGADAHWKSVLDGDSAPLSEQFKPRARRVGTVSVAGAQAGGEEGLALLRALTALGLGLAEELG